MCVAVYSAYLHGGSCETISELGLQLAAGLVDLGTPVLQLVSLIKHSHMPIDPQHIFQVASADRHGSFIHASIM